MARILFKLSGVPDDEADEVRQLLKDHDISFYETHAGNWGISVAAIWLTDDSRFDEARILLDEYQFKRAARLRNEYEQLSRVDRQRSWIVNLITRPLRLFVYGAIILAVIYLSIVPFMHWGSK